MKLLALAALAGIACPSALVMAAEPSAAPYGNWLAEDIAGGGVIDNLQTTLVLGADGQTGGRGGCNAYSGSHTLAGEKLSFGPAVATMMACPEAIMNQEQKFFRALEEVRAWRIDTGTGKLELSSADGVTVLVLAPLE